MAFDTTSRTNSEIILGNRVWFVRDGDTYGDDTAPQKASLTNVPTLEEAKVSGRCLGMIDTFKWAVNNKTVTKKGYSHEVQSHVSIDHKIRIGVKAQFTTQDVTSEAFALQYGIDSVPPQGESTTLFGAAAEYKGWLYIEQRAGLGTLPEDDALADIHVRGLLSLSDNPEHNDDLLKISYEFQVTKTPADSFRNIGLPEFP